jgi:hypothetical protein
MAKNYNFFAKNYFRILTFLFVFKSLMGLEMRIGATHYLKKILKVLRKFFYGHIKIHKEMQFFLRPLPICH